MSNLQKNNLASILTLIVLSLTAMLVFIVIFFVVITVTNIDNRRNNDLRHKLLSEKIDKFEELFINECRNLVDAVKDIKL